MSLHIVQLLNLVVNLQWKTCAVCFFSLATRLICIKFLELSIINVHPSLYHIKIPCFCPWLAAISHLFCYLLPLVVMESIVLLDICINCSNLFCFRCQCDGTDRNDTNGLKKSSTQIYTTSF